MRLKKNGDPVIDETRIGKVKAIGEFSVDPADVSVETVSDVWRVIRLSVPDYDFVLTPRAARSLARILIRAADKAKAEDAEIVRVQSNHAKKRATRAWSK